MTDVGDPFYGICGQLCIDMLLQELWWLNYAAARALAMALLAIYSLEEKLRTIGPTWMITFAPALGFAFATQPVLFATSSRSPICVCFSKKLAGEDGPTSRTNV
eukprot:CAMPEP_0114663852 /NCGR_PEP_ID=MMETSP0191-20121206/27719_1 /TAXON_ID=126664 /ORGANISM="Sorites sp." /LENGTH=103 /DNA_ID=CAMNT_0001904403 /DNA_START=341 /DNA_END=653 /DNA_ORIENTATION=-